MARDYAPLSHEYLEKMQYLSDAAFRRPCRALLRYSMSGETTQLRGPERLFLKRIFNWEPRYRASYDKQLETRRKAGKKGAAIRWHPPMAEPCPGMPPFNRSPALPQSTIRTCPARREAREEERVLASNNRHPPEPF